MACLHIWFPLLQGEGVGSEYNFYYFFALLANICPDMIFRVCTFKLWTLLAVTPLGQVVRVKVTMSWEYLILTHFSINWE